jgi:hypothetical protein
LRFIGIQSSKQGYPDLGTIEYVDRGLAFLTFGDDKREYTLDELLQQGEIIMDVIKSIVNK